ncbi:beta-galactosidase [Paenibacillus wynnii]|uniref:beta-galactosidase n=1 Tax=Paenibacillus wynnii TaxID=268407 RepID=A0A098M8C4_9BACL|nr:beta-galactosidase [Paenibacillus wynnii]KGE18799.1 hypothetical protein PWYN_05015 [Paenibacillus wynnii]
MLNRDESDLWARSRLGCQVWLEPDDTEERVGRLFEAAHMSGLGWVRLFLMWPWIEEKPGVWDFNVFDYAFNAAAKYGIQIKATLTANSGPWHIGTPSMLHSHTGFLLPEQREPMKEYITRCVVRYREHPALGQWILWNEPTGGGDRTEESLKHWQDWLAGAYSHEIEGLNKRWRTGYSSFGEVPFPEDIPREEHKGSHWNSYGPWLEDWKSRCHWLCKEIAWIKDRVREHDTRTETCVNPMPFLDNQAHGGMDLNEMGKVVEIMGASYHPAWNFTYTERQVFPGLIAAGVLKQAATPSVKRVEVTEVQTGNTLASSNRPCEASPDEIARFFLSGLAAGAESVTGWCLNVRSMDFEAGDWGLLTDMDEPSPRSRMLGRVKDTLRRIHADMGSWKPVAPQVRVLYDVRSQALEWVESMGLPPVKGRMLQDGANGAALINAKWLQYGIPAVMTRLEDLPLEEGSQGGLIFITHLVAWDDAGADRILSFVEAGGTLVLDATSGRKDYNARLHRPWPGGIASRIGMQSEGLQSNYEGYDIAMLHMKLGQLIAARAEVRFQPDAGWKPWREFRFQKDGQPLIHERPYGRGKIIYVNGLLGPSLVHEPSATAVVDGILHTLAKELAPYVQPAAGLGTAFALHVEGERGGTLSVIVAESRSDRGGKPMRLIAKPGIYHDYWSGLPVEVGNDGEMVLDCNEGVALIRESGTP